LLKERSHGWVPEDVDRVADTLGLRHYDSLASRCSAASFRTPEMVLPWD